MEKVIKVWLKYYPVYLSGLWGTLWISAVTVFLGALLGMVVALMRMSRLKILRTAFNVYVEILRGTPILLQLYFFWIGLPKLVPFELTDTQCIAELKENGQTDAWYSEYEEQAAALGIE